jgi:alkylation response protein AidB-like acyl-CoA dehydrogenase
MLLITTTEPGAGHDGFTLFLSPMQSPLVHPVEAARDTRHPRVRHRDTRLPGRTRARSAILGEIGQGSRHTTRQPQGNRLIGCASKVTLSQKAFDLALAYVKQREAFGKPIVQRPGRATLRRPTWRASSRVAILLRGRQHRPDRRPSEDVGSGRRRPFGVSG